jgi:hypothetical protein
MDLVREVRAAPHGMAPLARIMRYIFATNEPDKPHELVRRLLAAVGDEGKEEIMTAADQLIEIGREEGTRNMLQKMLRRRFGPLPEAVGARVAAASMAELEDWSMNLLTAPALDDVFTGGSPGN